MTEELVSFQTAQLAKEKGFDEECMHYWEWYENGKEGKIRAPLSGTIPIIDFREWGIPLEETRKRPMLYNETYWPIKNSGLPPWLYARPTQDLLERWLRENFNLRITIYDEAGNFYINRFYFQKMGELNKKGPETWYSTYELAREAALLYALNLLP